MVYLIRFTIFFPRSVMKSNKHNYIDRIILICFGLDLLKVIAFAFFSRSLQNVNEVIRSQTPHFRLILRFFVVFGIALRIKYVELLR